MKDGIGMVLVQRMQKEVAVSDDCLQVFPCLSCSLLKLVTSVFLKSVNESEDGNEYSNTSEKCPDGFNLISCRHGGEHGGELPLYE